MLQALYTLLDMGMSATLSRELAVGTSDERSSAIPTVLRTIEWIYLPIGPLIGVTTWILSDWLARYWLRTATIGVQEVASAISLLGVSAALQWPTSLYTAGLVGLQRQVLLNGLRILTSTLSSVGCLALLIKIPKLSAYVYWQIGFSALQSVLFAWVLYRVLPGRGSPGRFSWVELRRIRAFAGGVMGITLLSLALTQADRFVLSRILTLDQFGYYTLASSLAAVVYRVVQPIYLAYGPKYAQLVARAQSNELSRQYHLSNQAMALVLGPIMAMSVFFGNDIVLLWSRDPVLTSMVAPIFTLLVAAWTLHGLLNLPYALQLAHGWTSLALNINLASIFVVLPAFWILGSHYGSIGVASGWLLLTVVYAVLGLPLMHRRYLKGEAIRWLLQDIGPVLIACSCAAALLAAWLSPLHSGVFGWLQLGMATGLVFLAGLLAATQILALARVALART